MVQKVTDRGPAIPDAFLRAFPALTVTGPRLDLVGDPATEEVLMHFSWWVYNEGDTEGRAGLRVNLQIDAALGDQSQLIVEPDGSMAGALRDVAMIPYPPTVPTHPIVTVPPGEWSVVSQEIAVSVLHMVDRQGSVLGFNWWIVELTARDVDADALLPMYEDLSEARYEVRDWFRVAEVVAPPVAKLIALEEAGYSAFVRTFPELVA